MRLLAVGHPLVIAHNQQKYARLKQLDPSLELRIAIPAGARGELGAYRAEIHPQLSAQEVIAFGSFFSCSHMTELLDPRGLARLVREFRPDVIHVEEEPHAATSVLAARLCETAAPGAALTVFSWDNLHRRRAFPLGALKKALWSYTAARASAIVCGNRQAARLAARAGFSGPVPVLPQFGLDPDAHEPGTESALRRELGLNDAFVVGYAGRLLPRKGLSVLLPALAGLLQRSWKLLLVGAGPMEREIRKRWMKSLAGRLVCVPAVPHGLVPRYLRCLDVFVLASYSVRNWKEQFGLTLAQAMMLGLPCIVSDSGALPEVAGPGALVAPERDAEALRETLDAVLHSQSLRRDLGQRGRARALEQFTWTSVAARYLDVFRAAAGQRTRAAAAMPSGNPPQEMPYAIHR